ncbi:MAG: SAM-dependent methyltransferase [Bacteroidota bacterium]|nr:SAM-dependent methyltransferase [Bacteroidota bacterium]
MSNKGKLFLIPAPIAADTQDMVIPAQVRKDLPDIHHFLAEDIRTARRYLSALKIYDRIDALSFSVLDKDTKRGDLEEMFTPIREGHHLGVLSESGCPGVADPGALAVEYAHDHGIAVIPLVGPSSIILALMASGLNGQHFAFHGYLPVQTRDAAKAIREFESESRTRNQTQIFIETPYRNNSLFASLSRNLAPATRLCLAVDVTGANEFIRTRSVEDWRRDPVSIAKYPAVFLFLA